MLVYNVDEGSGESAQLTGESADVLTDYLKKKGYSFVTITEMAELKNIELKFDKTYYGF